MDEVEAKLKQLEEELEAESEASERALREARAAAEEEGEDDLEETDAPPPEDEPDDAAEEDDEDDGLDLATQAAATALVASAGGSAGRSLTRRAAKVAQQNLPSLPSRSSVKEGALVMVGLGFAGMVAWHYLGWLLAIPLMILKAGALGAALYGGWWLLSRALSEDTPDEDGDEEGD